MYRVTRKKDGLKFAVKRIALPVDERKKAKFEKEAKALCELNHGHIVKLYLPTYRFREGPEGKYQILESYM